MGIRSLILDINLGPDSLFPQLFKKQKRKEKQRKEIARQYKNDRDNSNNKRKAVFGDSKGNKKVKKEENKNYEEKDDKAKDQRFSEQGLRFEKDLEE